MRRITSGRVALAISVTALFVALGGTAFAVTQIGTNQIQNGAVTTPKLHDGAVTNPKLANNSVGNAKIKDNSITSNKVKPNTFLAANGTAANANRLGGLLPADFVQGVGFVTQRRIVVANNSASILMNTSLGTFTASCSAGGLPQVSWAPNVSDAEYSATVVTGPSSNTKLSLVTLNGISNTTSDPEPFPATGPFSITYEIGTTEGGLDKVVSANVIGRFEFDTGCVFVGQELSSGD